MGKTYASHKEGAARVIAKLGEAPVGQQADVDHQHRQHHFS